MKQTMSHTSLPAASADLYGYTARMYRYSGTVPEILSSTDWNLLDEEVRLGRWNNYAPSMTPFKLLGSGELC